MDHQKSTADASAQVTEDASEVVAGHANEKLSPLEMRRRLERLRDREEESHPNGGNSAAGEENDEAETGVEVGHSAEIDEAVSTLEDRYALKSLLSKRSLGGYEPVLTRAHDLPYKEFLRLRAMNYAEKGLRIFPCFPMDSSDGRKAKAPITRNGLKDASADPAQVSRWWSPFPNTGFPDALIAATTGLYNGFWVLDVDMKNGVDGLTELRKLEAKFGPLPETHRVRTPSGGIHYYFKWVEGVEIRNSAGKVARGIDVRGSGGYVCLPPSMLTDGQTYEELTDTTPYEAAWAPAWLLDLVKATSSPARAKALAKVSAQSWAFRILAKRCDDVAGAEEGTRNETLNKAAFSIGRLVGDGALDRSAAFDTLMEAAKKAGLEEAEARKTIQSGLTAGAKEKGTQPQWPDVAKRGQPIVSSIDNVRAVLSWMGVTLRYNMFIERAEMTGFPPYSLLNDSAWAELWSAAFDYGFQVGKPFLANALEAIALQDKYHPVRDYFEGLVWDGAKRLDKLFIDYAGADDNEYVRAVGAKTLIAAARRIYQPGTKFDTACVIEGPQGSGKSSMLRVLAVRDEWFTDGLSVGMRAKEVIEIAEGVLIAELSELKGMKHTDVEAAKAFLSRTHDKDRKAYGRFTTNLARQFVILASTNSSEYLKDRTGNRRFWPVRTGDEIDLASLKRDRDQIWAEAVQRHKAGESLILPRHLWEFAAAEQEKRVAQHPWVAILDEAFQGQDGEPMLGKVRAEDVWALVGKQDPSRRTTYDMIDLGDAMKNKLKWTHTRLRMDGKRTYCYTRGAGKQLREITVTARFGEKPIVRYAKESAEAEF